MAERREFMLGHRLGRGSSVEPEDDEEKAEDDERRDFSER
jgi:hypothetical protein